MLSIKVSRFVQFDEDDVMHAVKMLTKNARFSDRSNLADQREKESFINPQHIVCKTTAAHSMN